MAHKRKINNAFTGLDNGLPVFLVSNPIWTQTHLLTGHMGRDLQLNLIQIQQFMNMLIGLKMPSAKCEPFCLDIDGYIKNHPLLWECMKTRPITMCIVSFIPEVRVMMIKRPEGNICMGADKLPSADTHTSGLKWQNRHRGHGFVITSIVSVAYYYLSMAYIPDSSWNLFALLSSKWNISK